MKESDLVSAIMTLLRTNGFYCIKLHGGPYMQPGLPDILAIRYGRAFFFEVKLPGRKPTRIQEHVMKELREHGAPAVVVTSVDEVQEVLELETAQEPTR